MARMPDEMRDALMQVWYSRNRENMPNHQVSFAMGVDTETAILRQSLSGITFSDYQREQLAHGLELQGRYEEALQYCAPGRRKILQGLINARDRDDFEFCNCQAAPVQMELVWSTRHDAWVAVLACPQCQTFNITPEQLKPEMLRQYEMWVVKEKQRQANATR